MIAGGVGILEKGQLVELMIEDLSAEGQGIGRESGGADGNANGSTDGGTGGSTERGGLVVFVPETLPGDRVRARITKVKKSYAFGRVEEFLECSPYRNEDFDCPYADQGCGGCPYGKLDYGMQLQVKAFRDKILG